MKSVFCWLGLHKWHPRMLGFIEEASYYRQHGTLPRIEWFCVECGKDSGIGSFGEGLAGHVHQGQTPKETL